MFNQYFLFHLMHAAAKPRHSRDPSRNPDRLPTVSGPHDTTPPSGYIWIGHSSV